MKNRPYRYMCFVSLMTYIKYVTNINNFIHYKLWTKNVCTLLHFCNILSAFYNKLMEIRKKQFKTKSLVWTKNLKWASAATAKSLESCPTLCNPIDAAHQAPPFLGFSRQEHWSGLPFPSPMHESEKWKWSRSVATPWTAAYQAPPCMDFPGKSTGVGCHCLLWPVMI